ncbi:unnamed protein product [Prorocentrum cordatum]|uniref:Beta-mannosidase n=1 Tax=Prorocentrum cordatum TaxID=2364126 RepID=A0ABN9W095_9DINO|nr:unnamed protein product [Polarella glacialis]
MLGILSARREALFPAHIWNASSPNGGQGGREETGRGGGASVLLELQRLASFGGPLDLDCLTSWPPCGDLAAPASLDARLGGSYDLGPGAASVRLALSVPGGLPVAVGSGCSADAVGAVATLERLQLASGRLSFAALNITVPDVARGLWVAYNFSSSPAAEQSLCIHTPEGGGGLLSFITAGVPVVWSAEPSSSIRVGEAAGARRRALRQEDAALGSVGSTRADIVVHSGDESIDMAVVISHTSIGLVNFSMSPVVLSVGPFQLSEEPDPTEHHGHNALLDCYRGRRTCEVMKLWTSDVLATASSGHGSDSLESSLGLSIVAPDGGDLIAHLFWDWSRDKQHAYRVQGAISGQGLVDVSFLWPRFLLPSSLLGASPGRRLVSEETVGLELAFNLTDPWDGSEVLHGSTTGGLLSSVYFTGVDAFVDPTGERPTRVAANLSTDWAVDMGGDIDIRLTIPAINFVFTARTTTVVPPRWGTCSWRGSSSTPCRKSLLCSTPSVWRTSGSP